MALPDPEHGLVISYAYLWRSEAREGIAEGRKNRPCAIILSVQREGEHTPLVTVAPITHTSPADPTVAIEIPLAVKQHLHLDSERSWVVLDDLNMFTWPGFDLAPVPGSKDRYHYGFLPPAFYRKLIEKFAELRRQRRAAPTSRDEV
jgi:hypothetical protein